MASSFDRARADAALLAEIRGQGSSGRAELAAEYGTALLPLLEQHLARDLPFDALERLERVLKLVMRDVCAAPPSGPAARDLARFQKRVGLLFKYKSYTVKAAHPLGYSIFLQNPAQGFSFQRHVTHKVEVFHVLDVHPGGYVFLCDYADWLRFYTRDGFSRWFDGEPNSAIERHRFYPQPGDVISIDRLNVVHTVVGCTIEEFATTSTDMVDRLHDQNPRDRIPAHFTREYAQARLRSLRAPGMTGRQVRLTAGGFETRPLHASSVPGGQRLVLEDRFLTAARWVVGPGETSAFDDTEGDAVALYVFEGTGSLEIVAPDESSAPPPAMSVAAGDALIVPTGVRFRLAARAPDALGFSLHRGPYETLLAL